MRITIVKTEKDNVQRLQTREASLLFERIATETGKSQVFQFRYASPKMQYPERSPLYREIADVYPALELRRQENGALGMKQFNGLVTLEVRSLSSQQEADRVKRRAMDAASTLAAFVGLDERSVVILVAVTPAEGGQPRNEAEAELLYKRAYYRLLPVYDGILGTPVTRMEPLLRHSFKMTCDPQLLTNPEAVPFRIGAAPAEADTDETDSHLLALPEPEPTEQEQSWEAFEVYEDAFHLAVEEAVGKATGVRDSDEWQQTFLTALAHGMQRRGVPEEEAVLHVWHHFQFKVGSPVTEDAVRAVVGAAYASSASQARTTAESGEARLMRHIIRRMTTRYQFRMNTIMGYVEYRPNHSWPTPWRAVTEKVVNTFTTDLQLSGLAVWDRDVRRFVNSTRIRDYNPVDEYLFRLSGKWDGRDHIGALAATVPTDTPREWTRWFHTWFLAMVAQWRGLDRRFGNSIVPLLISKQGLGKSAFCRQLLPPELRSWGYTDHLALGEDRSVHLAMAQMLLVNLDEFNAISQKKQEGFLKNIVQLPSVKVKRPYGRHIEDVHRLASFIATTNLTDVLTDPTGSRRFIGVQVTGRIDLSQTPNYEQLYAQAMDELDKQHVPYWFDDEENARIMQHNQRFRQRTSEEDFFYEYFTPTDDAAQGEWMTAAAILTHIKTQARASFRLPTSYRMGRLLRNLPGLQHKRTTHGEQYLVVKR